ncbi:carcinoembryonic antigen-related cell adhesion molecule 5-like isoform X2 [Carcharodon carcharias]|uniref:carcinoembryonic antigen-related cell adhesion molecule 5-like isoform X2 n=1 Tax=Carcharodon carcharias TaxID=13397 RepID=UPI001B7EA59F|nr:carcinoembryonic antigen-related cell adhesion molecule 5-like isoform X2 [Carcharodon carcharias]
MWRLTLTAVAVCLLISVAEPQGFTILTENSRINVTVGGNALFSVKPSGAVRSGNWDFKGETVGRWIGINVDFNNEYKTRAEIFFPNGSFLLKSVTVSDSGDYTVSMTPVKGNDATATIALHVLEPVSKPTISSNDTNPVEYNDTVVLTCHASGTAVSYQWLKDNKTINSSDRIGLSSDNSTLTIYGLLRSDEEFTCYGYNMINENTSDLYLLNVNYGPESLNISISPQLAFYISGSNVNFSCSAISKPISEFQWYLNGNSLQQNIQQLIITEISLNNTGNYTCEAYNNATKRYSLTTIDMTTVVEPVSKPNVIANVTNPVEHNDTVTLTCFASGTTVSYQWLEDNSTIIPDNRFILSDDNRTLTISGVLRSDGGFMCYAFNSFSRMTSDPYNLNVSYGPDLPNISINPDLSTYLSGRAVTFSCSVDSNPPAELEWYLNDTSLQQKGQQLNISSITLNGTGNYTCQAFNNLTKRYGASTKQIVVIEPVSNVIVSSNNSKPVENVDTVSLTCNATGSIQSRIWYKDKQVIKHNDRIITSLNNDTLTLINVNRHDSGTYKCNAGNDFSTESGDIKLQVNYGPENVSITPSGPIVEQGNSLTLTCTAVSVPPATYEWYNGSKLLKAGETYSTEPINSNPGGNYTCRVNNSITKISKNTTVQVTVQEKHEKESKLSTGAKVGIAFAVLGCVVILVVVIVLCMKKKCKIFRASAI